MEPKELAWMHLYQAASDHAEMQRKEYELIGRGVVLKRMYSAGEIGREPLMEVQDELKSLQARTGQTLADLGIAQSLYEEAVIQDFLFTQNKE